MLNRSAHACAPWLRIVGATVLAGCVLTLGGCEVEKRRLGASPPVSPPTGASDQRASFYATNRYEMSEGGRMFRWYGCDACHTEGAPGYLNLADEQWRHGGGVPEIYRAIAAGAPGMPAYQDRMTPEQIWRTAGFVHGLKQLKPGQRVRGSKALEGEASGSSWNGPL